MVAIIHWQIIGFLFSLYYCGKFYTWLKTFTQPAIVMVFLTNMKWAKKCAKKYQCNCFHKMLIECWMFEWSNVPMFQCSNVPIANRIQVPMDGKITNRLPHCTMGFHITFKEMEQICFLQNNIVTSNFIGNFWNLFTWWYTTPTRICQIFWSNMTNICRDICKKYEEVAS